MDSANIAQQPAAVAKDDKFFYESGDCTFLVGGVLFKLHKYCLSRDPETPSFFQNLFNDARGSVAEIIPLDDALDDFRDLCWALYADPVEVYQLTVDLEAKKVEVDVKRFLHILDLSCKYVLPRLESWSLQLLRRKDDLIASLLDACTEDEMERMFGLAMRCSTSASGLLDLVETKWLARVTGGTFSYGRALTTGELHGRRGFQTALYLKVRSRLLTGPRVTSFDLGLSHYGLNEKQLQRFLYGHAILSNLYQTFPHGGLSTGIPQYFGCGTHAHCGSIWAKILALDHRDSVPILRIAWEHRASSANPALCVAYHVGLASYPDLDLVDEVFVGKET
ncbi:hypothetical protein MKEN_00957100 [Mycena kentingensis (nom. inval.)]|nr:hypothetical protein MKEN_00957100 [Mycena kentingensis (nom. inval.)]